MIPVLNSSYFLFIILKSWLKLEEDIWVKTYENLIWREHNICTDENLSFSQNTTVEYLLKIVLLYSVVNHFSQRIKAFPFIRDIEGFKDVRKRSVIAAYSGYWSFKIQEALLLQMNYNKTQHEYWQISY